MLIIVGCLIGVGSSVVTVSRLGLRSLVTLASFGALLGLLVYAVGPLDQSLGVYTFQNHFSKSLFQKALQREREREREASPVRALRSRN